MRRIVIQILSATAAVTLVAGCTELRKDMGASAENDQNVLTGGPVTGTTLADLPTAVKSTLKQKMPTAEVADIEKENWSGRTVYQISFIHPGANPVIYVSQDGQILSKPGM